MSEDLQRLADAVLDQEAALAEGRYRKAGGFLVPVSAAGLEVWPVLTWQAHGDEMGLLGVYASREAAFRALKAAENMAVWVDDRGHLRGHPRRETAFARWAHGWPAKVEG